MAGVSGPKFPGIRAHFQQNISAVYNNLDVSFTSYPPDDQSDPEAYKTAIDALPPGSAVTIFTPDSTHFPIALYAIRRRLHVLITKPATKLLEHHLALLTEAREYGVLVYIEHHKRFDPVYVDARARAAQLGPFNYFYSYMSQPKSQLSTFRNWAGRESDISYYLNSHHVDVCDSMVSGPGQGRGQGQGWGFVPVRVTGLASLGTAVGVGCVNGTEDTITLLVEWRGRGEGDGEDGTNRVATGVYTASWTAPQGAGVHSNQYFHCELRIPVKLELMLLISPLMFV